MSKQANDIVVVEYARTPFDKFLGITANMHSIQFTTIMLKELIKRSGIKPEQVDEINLGSAYMAEMAIENNIPARQALEPAGFPVTTLSATIDRACCSSTTALQITWRNLRGGYTDLSFTIGTDNMSNVPLLFDPKLRHKGFRMGDFVLKDKLMAIGYGDNVVAYDAGKVAVEHGVTREMQDEWSVGSHEKWGKAFDRGYFKEEIFPIEVPQGKSAPLVLEKDQSPRPGTNMEALSKLKTIYGSPTVTAGNAPGMNSGSSGIILTTRKKAEELGLKPLAKIIQIVSLADNYENIAVTPAAAIRKALKTADMKLDDIELIEINEAFAAMPLVSTKLLAEGDEGKWSYLKSITNVNGGAVAIGHPIGATGLRITGTLIRELRNRGGKFGVAAICGGMAQGDAVLVEVE